MHAHAGGHCTGTGTVARPMLAHRGLRGGVDDEEGTGMERPTRQAMRSGQGLTDGARR
jgi:hypothetical protein